MFKIICLFTDNTNKPYDTYFQFTKKRAGLIKQLKGFSLPFGDCQ